MDQETPDTPHVELAAWQYQDSYIADLRTKTGYYTGYVPRYLVSLVAADYNHELLRTDDLVTQCLELLGIQIAGSQHRISVIDNPIMESLLSAALRFLPRFAKHRQEQTANMVLYGMGTQKMHWAKRPIPGFPGVWEVPVMLSEIDPRRIGIEGRPGGSGAEKFPVGSQPPKQDSLPLPYFTIWEPEYDAFIKVLDRATNPSYKHCAQDYVWSFYNQDELSAGYGRGLNEILYRLVYIRNQLLQRWPKLAEKFGTPFPVVYLDFKNRAGVFDDDGTLNNLVTAETESRRIAENLQKQLSNDVLVVDGDLVKEIKWVEFGSVSIDLIERQIQYLDRRITQVILMNEASTAMGDKGSYAQTNLLVGVANTRIANYRQGLEEDYRRDLLYSGFVYRNRFELLKWDIPIPSLSDISIKFFTRAEELKEEVIEKLTSESEAKKLV